jgi:hypothetical protein
MPNSCFLTCFGPSATFPDNFSHLSLSQMVHPGLCAPFHIARSRTAAYATISGPDSPAEKSHADINSCSFFFVIIQDWGQRPDLDDPGELPDMVMVSPHIFNDWSRIHSDMYVGWLRTIGPQLCTYYLHNSLTGSRNVQSSLYAVVLSSCFSLSFCFLLSFRFSFSGFLVFFQRTTIIFLPIPTRWRTQLPASTFQCPIGEIEPRPNATGHYGSTQSAWRTSHPC